jgi:hypothetical protein
MEESDRSLAGEFFRVHPCLLWMPGAGFRFPSLAEDSAAFLLPINNRKRNSTRSVQEAQATTAEARSAYWLRSRNKRGTAHRAGWRCTYATGNLSRIWLKRKFASFDVVQQCWTSKNVLDGSWYPRHFSASYSIVEKSKKVASMC